MTDECEAHRLGVRDVVFIRANQTACCRDMIQDNSIRPVGAIKRGVRVDVWNDGRGRRGVNVSHDNRAGVGGGAKCWDTSAVVCVWQSVARVRSDVWVDDDVEVYVYVSCYTAEKSRLKQNKTKKRGTNAVETDDHAVQLVPGSSRRGRITWIF